MSAKIKVFTVIPIGRNKINSNSRIYHTKIKQFVKISFQPNGRHVGSSQMGGLVQTELFGHVHNCMTTQKKLMHKKLHSFFSAIAEIKVFLRGMPC